jgi:dipeptidyl aminopeptidase/acylaminoacyl peptidase
MSVEDRVRRDLERLPPADPAGAFERISQKRLRRRVVRRAKVVLLAFAVIFGSIGGFVELTRIFRREPMFVAGPVSPFPIVPHANGWIAYADGSRLVTMQPDGSDPLTVPTPPGGPWFATWSPDGTKLAVTIFPGGEEDRSIWVMNANGSDPVQVAAAENVSEASWSPDGSRIAYAATDGGTTSIHIVGADGTNDAILHQEGAPGTHEIFSASFSPDGTKILFDAGTDSGFDIFVMNVDGSNVQQLTRTGTDYDPAWSPDGRKIAFARQGSGSQSDIYVMDSDGSNVVQLTDDGGGHTDLGPTWSPDGTKIAFEAGVMGGPGPLDVMNADGSHRTTLVSDGVIGIGWAIDVGHVYVTLEPPVSAS